ncbi:hypothetical protein [Brevundimonas sp.]|uniref:hypothetical protein n=1 Tax=Brevundimonas sp. TaxID=1871086 RepID=UPI0019B3896B|nr:hypothetical protein [Brevundimonas sp.]MBD3835974.1 hypothetical protein [Brevundimonas sp.]
MTLPRDLIPPSMRATLDAARRMADPFEDVRRQHDMLRASGVLGIAERMKLETPLALAAMGLNPFMDRMQGVGALMRAQTDADRVYRAAFPNGLIEQAERIAQLSAGFALPDGLERFRTPTDSFVDRILRLSDSGLGASALAIGRPAQIEAFARASAMADMFAESDRLTRGVREAVGAFSITEMPQFANLAGYRSFLDAAGLRLAHWPRRRLLTMAEKRRRLKARLQANSAPPHVKRAKTLVHRYELTLREILDAVMAETYGEDWADERLPLCDCKDLLGKWKKRGGEVFDHADYTHYARIMSHPEHFQAIFEAGFDDPEAVFDLLKQAGKLRAASHHAHLFTPEDLKALRLTWNQIETGLIALTPDFELEWMG